MSPDTEDTQPEVAGGEELEDLEASESDEVSGGDGVYTIHRVPGKYKAGDT